MLKPGDRSSTPEVDPKLKERDIAEYSTQILYSKRYADDEYEYR